MRMPYVQSDHANWRGFAVLIIIRRIEVLPGERDAGFEIMKFSHILLAALIAPLFSLSLIFAADAQEPTESDRAFERLIRKF